MTHPEIREKFLKFFKDKGHTFVSSSSLLPTDPSVLFTTAGMQQFKPYYTGEADPMKDFNSLNAVSVQKSMRTSDIDEVGDELHLTFFEMLGNFSFSGYWKKGAIEYSYDFITKELGVSSDRIKVSVFKGDAQTPPDLESLEIWRDSGFPDDKIIFGGRGDNFWGPTGNKGPCGPTTEIYVDGAEVWNLVFNEFFCDEEGHFLPLTKKGIDTGMGLERLAMILQNKKSVFETDLFVPIIEEVRGKNLYDYEKNAKPERIIADHLRASVFLIADGVMPSNVTQGYVLRRLLRRAIRYVKQLDLTEDLYERVVHVMAHDIYKGVYSELGEKKRHILEVITAEKNKFEKTLDRGLREFEKLISENKNVVSGQDAFNLYATFGFPIELIEELAREKKLEVDAEGFKQEIEAHKTKSRAGAERKFGGHGLILNTGELRAGREEELKKITRLHTATHLLNQALHNVLGESIRQAGSDITAERTRFDFTFSSKVTPEELKKVEDEVNKKIQEDLPVQVTEVPKKQAIEGGARSFRPEKYPEIVKVYFIGTDKDWRKAYSKELCGGPHVNHTAEIGKFKITKEGSISAGIRRIRAVVG